MGVYFVFSTLRRRLLEGTFIYGIFWRCNLPLNPMLTEFCCRQTLVFSSLRSCSSRTYDFSSVETVLIRSFSMDAGDKGAANRKERFWNYMSNINSLLCSKWNCTKSRVSRSKIINFKGIQPMLWTFLWRVWYHINAPFEDKYLYQCHEITLLNINT